MLRLHALRTVVAHLGLTALLFCAPTAYADDLAQASLLLRDGKAQEALQVVDDALSKQPRDAQLRFLRGVILSEQNRVNDAITVFTQLSQDFPELPEPYNNVAVLYAGQGAYDKARVALEMAIRTNPAYGTAYENLGDVYAQLAGQAYGKALQIDENNRSVTPKLLLIRELFAAAPTTPAAPSTPADAPPPAAPTSTTETSGTVASAAAVPASTAPAAPSEPASGTTEVAAAIAVWADAWSRQDVPSYLAAYAPDFETPGQRTRSQWERDRQRLITNKTRIRVTLGDISIERDGDVAVAHFRQTYESPEYRSVTRKTLALARSGDTWLIQREQSRP